MADSAPTPVDPWRLLRSATLARVGLGRSGGSLPTSALLDFEAAHAAARDAVWREFDPDRFQREIAAAGIEACFATSAAPDRDTYLERPELGRRLAPASRQDLSSIARGSNVAIIASDGLSSSAVDNHGRAVIEGLYRRLKEASVTVAPLIVIQNARVAIQDEIGELLGARVAVIVLGERPGLAAPDSLGAYLVYEPRVGRTDADRNCVSNIHAAGLAPELASEKIAWLVLAALRRGISGVALKDESDRSPADGLARLFHELPRLDNNPDNG